MRRRYVATRGQRSFALYEQPQGNSLDAPLPCEEFAPKQHFFESCHVVSKRYLLNGVLLAEIGVSYRSDFLSDVSLI